MLSPGTVFASEFTVESALSEGEAGEIYVVSHKGSGRRRSLVLIDPARLSDLAQRERLAQAAHVGARIDSEHLVEVLAAGVEPAQSQPYLVTELLDGQPIAARVTAHGALPPGEALLVLRQLGHALRAAHAAGVVHGALRPESVWLTRSRRADAGLTVKVLDFGVAALLTEADAARGAPPRAPLWMAPEQSDADAACTAATDVWAFGLIAFFLLTGRSYWLGSASGSTESLLSEVLTEPMPPASLRAAAVGGASLPSGFDAWFAKATARAPSDRWPDGGAALAALESILAPHAASPGVTAPGASIAYAPPPHRAPSAGPPGHGPSGPRYSAAAPPGGAPKPSAFSRFWPVIFGLAAVAATGTFALTRPGKEAARPSRDGDDDEERARPPRSAKADGAVAPAPGSVSVEMYVMSQCPYAVQVENTFKQVMERIGPSMTLRLEYIGTNQAGELGSMHGPAELAGDRAQICAMKHTPKWFDLVLCQNESVKEVDTNWRACADRLGIPTEPIAKCIEAESTALLTASFQRSSDSGAKGSPTILINGQKYEGRRNPSDFVRAICNAHGAPVPAACRELPVVPAVTVTLLADARCSDCSSRSLESQLGKIINPALSKLDYGTPDGRRLFDEIKPAKLPALVFDASLDGDVEAARSFEKLLRSSGKYRVTTSGTWNPSCADSGGCETDECRGTVVCRPEAPKQLDLFLMSQCPFAAKGLLALKEVLADFQRSNEKLDVRLHYIGTGDEVSGLKSLHGEAEVAEDLRQVCAIEHYPRNLKFLDYIMCRAKDHKSADWEACTGSNGVDPATLRSCSTGAEGKRLLAASFAFSAAEGANASPTWFTNARYKFSGIDAETIKRNVCEKNRLRGCAATLSGAPPRP